MGGFQSYDRALSFATDAWMSPNHQVFVAITVHFADKGVPISMLLDIIEVACSHSGLNLVAAFAEVLEEFGISHKVSSTSSQRLIYLPCTAPFDYLQQRIEQRHDDCQVGRAARQFPRSCKPNPVLYAHYQSCCEKYHSTIRLTNCQGLSGQTSQ